MRATTGHVQLPASTAWETTLHAEGKGLGLVKGLGFRVWGFGFRVAGFRALGFGA